MARHSLRKGAAVTVLLLCLISPKSTLAAAFAYVIIGGNELVVIDTATRSVIATIPVGVRLQHPFVHPNGRSVYVSSDTDDVNVKTVSVIDAATNVIARTFALPPGDLAVGIHPDGNHLLAFHVGCPGALQIRDIETLEANATLPVACYPAGLAVTPDGTRAYVRNSEDVDPRHGCFFDPLQCQLDISVLDLVNQQPLTTLRNVGSRLLSITADPLGRTIYVGALTRVPDVGVRWALLEIDTETSAVSHYTPLPAGGPGTISIPPEGAPLYLFRGGNLQIFDPLSRTSIWSLNLNGVLHMAMTPDGAALYLPASGEDPRVDGVLVLDIATRSIVDRIHVGRHPMQIVIGPDVPITPPPTPLGSATPTPSPTVPPMTGCTADCNADGVVGVNELVTAVAIALRRQSPRACLAADCYHSECAGQGGDVGVACLVRAVGAALKGCPDQRCTEDADCNDFNPCTRDSCASGLCASLCVCN